MRKDQPDYGNARDVLPARLLREVQKRFEGGLLWVPARARQRRKTRRDAERNRQIVRDRRSGRCARELARRHRLSVERIRQIVKEAKRET